MFGRGLNRTNQKLKTKIKKRAREIKIDVEIRTGVQLHKIININPIGDAIRAVTNWGTKMQLTSQKHAAHACCRRPAPCKPPAASHRRKKRKKGEAYRCNGNFCNAYKMIWNAKGRDWKGEMKNLQSQVHAE